MSKQTQFAHLFPKMLQPGDSEVTFEVFKSTWHYYCLNTHK